MKSLKEQLLEKLGISEQSLEAKIAEKRLEAQSPSKREAEQRAATEHLSRAPRYPGAHALTMAEARSILAGIPDPPANPQVDGIFDPETLTLPSVQQWRGDIVLQSLHLPAEGSNLFVEGSLSVTGILKQDFRAGHLLVLGDLSVRHLVTSAEIACTGNLSVSGVLFGNCTNYGTNVWGRASAKVLISAKEHHFSFWGNHEVELMIDVSGDTPNLAGHHYNGDTMHEVLHPDFGDGYDEERVVELIRKRDTVLLHRPD